MYRFLFFYANMIVNKNEVLNKVKLKLKLQTDPFRKRLTTFSVGLPRTVCSFVCDFIALEIMESELVSFHDDNFCYVP